MFGPVLGPPPDILRRIAEDVHTQVVDHGVAFVQGVHQRELRIDGLRHLLDQLVEPTDHVRPQFAPVSHGGIERAAQPALEVGPGRLAPGLRALDRPARDVADRHLDRPVRDRVVRIDVDLHDVLAAPRLGARLVAALQAVGAEQLLPLQQGGMRGDLPVEGRVGGVAPALPHRLPFEAGGQVVDEFVKMRAECGDVVGTGVRTLVGVREALFEG